MNKLSYAVLGHGRWGKRLVEILTGMSRHVVTINISRPDDTDNEGIGKYKGNIELTIKRDASDVDVVWAAVPPGQHYLIAKTLLELNKHVIMEKPWMCDEKATSELKDIASQRGLYIGINYQFCFLEAISAVLERMGTLIKDAQFSGEFVSSRYNRLSISPLYNLGSHLMAVKCLWFRDASLGEIRTGYMGNDRRIMRIKHPSGYYEIDFLTNKEPLVQRLVNEFERCVFNKEDFPIGLDIAYQVYDALRNLEFQPH